MYVTCQVKYARLSALEAFYRQITKARRQHFLRTIMRRPAGLLKLAQVVQEKQIQEAYSVGIQHVPIEYIRGSEGRAGDFDHEFRPLKKNSADRWSNIATAHSIGNLLPAVELIQINRLYFVRDGHHRISVARAVGQLYIEANVTVWRLTEPETISEITEASVVRSKSVFARPRSLLQQMLSGRQMNDLLLQGG